MYSTRFPQKPSRTLCSKCFLLLQASTSQTQTCHEQLPRSRIDSYGHVLQHQILCINFSFQYIHTEHDTLHKYPHSRQQITLIFDIIFQKKIFLYEQSLLFISPKRRAELSISRSNQSLQALSIAPEVALILLSFTGVFSAIPLKRKCFPFDLGSMLFTPSQPL